MPDLSHCPGGEELRQLASGTLAPVSAEPVLQHLRQCRSCLSALEGMPLEDTLIEALQTWGDRARDGDKAAVEGLIQRLKKLVVGPAADPEATAADAPSTKGNVFDFLSPPQGADEIGRLGGYRVVKVLGQGGMGVVFAAEDVRLKRKVALKVMKPEIAANEGARQRFLREAEASAAVRSDHVITIYQVGEQGDAPFLAMEYLEGMSLDDWLKKGRKPTLAQAARMGRQIALGLAAAHERGLIHRDIKPANIWLESHHQGRVKLLDFGLARGTADEVHLTQSGAIVGTPAYMAPEQARGEHVDHRVDLFSLGVVLYRLTTGQLPFRGDNTMSMLMSLAVDTPKPPREINTDLPPRLASLIERLLSKDREQRPGTAKAVADELAAIEREATGPAADDRTLQVQAASVAPIVRAAHAAQRSKRWRWLVAASLLLVLGGVAAAIVVIIRDKQGNKIVEINAPEGKSVEVKNDDNKEQVKKAPIGKAENPIPAAPLAPLRANEPLSRVSLVQRPAKLPGVRSWSIEKRDSWMTTVVAYRPDGKRLAVGDSDGRVRIWEPQSGRLVQMAFDTRPIGFLAWSPDSKMLAVGVSINAGQSAIQLWDAQAGRTLWRVETPRGGGLGALAWSADGRTLLSTVTNVGCLTWNPADGKLLRRVAILCGLAAFSPDAKRLAGDTPENRLALWDVETGKEIRKLEEHKPAALPSLAWSPDGKRLALTAADGVFVWQAETGKRIGHYKDLPQGEFVRWSPNGRTLAVSRGNGPNGAVVVADVEAEGQPRRLEDDGSASVAWSPDGITIARIAWGGGWVRLYDAASGKRQRSLTEGSGTDIPALFSADGQTVAVAENGEITLSSTDTGQVLWRLKEKSGAFALSPDGKRLATGGPDHAVIIWENGGKVRVPLVGHQQDATWLVWSLDGKRLASSSAGEKRMLLWDADKGEKLRELGPFPAAAQSPTWSPDGRFLAFSTHPLQEIGWHIWDVEQNKLINNPKEWKDPYFVWSPDGRSALVGRYGSEYRLRDRTSGKEIRSLPLGGHPWGSLPAWSPDGRLLAVMNPNGGVELWRGDLSRRVLRLHETHYMHQFTLLKDGKLMVGLSGQRVYLWETETGRLHGTLFLGEQSNGFTISADGHYTGNEQVERGIVMVVQKDDGTQELLEPTDFEEKYGWKNDPNKVHLLQPLPPPPYPLPGMPMGPYALVREPAELPDPNARSWTVETVHARGRILSMAYRPDGKRLATGGDDGTIRILDAANGKLIRMLVGNPVSLLSSLSWSKDGILAAGSLGEVALWEAETGRLLRRFVGDGPLAWSPDGKYLATGIALQLWDKTSGRVVHMHAYPNEIQGLAWSPDRKTLAVGLHDGTARLWDVASWKETHKLEGHEGGDIRNLAWSPDGKRLITGAIQGKPNFHVWDTASGKLQGRFPVEIGFAGTFNGFAWSLDGKAVAIAPYGGVYDPDNGRRIHPFEVGGNETAMAFTADSKQIAVADNNGIHLHDAASGKRTHALEDMIYGGIYSLSWSPDGGSLAVGASFPALPIVEAATGRSRPALAEYERAGAWSPDGKIFAACGRDGRVHLLASGTYRLLRTLEGDGGDCTALAWSADGKLLAMGAHSAVRVWSVETGKQLWQKDKRASAVAWSPDGRRLATTDNSDDKAALRLWEAETGKLLHELPLRAEGALAWSPDGKRLVALPIWGEEGLLIDAETGAVQRKLKTGNGNCCVRWSSDGKTFTSLGNQGQLREWDAATGEIQRTSQLPGVQGFIRSAAWSSDGRVLAWASGKAIHLHTADGHPLGAALPFDPFAHLMVTADGRYRGNARVERAIRMVVQKSDGTTETLTPSEFEQKYNFKNDPAKVRLIDK